MCGIRIAALGAKNTQRRKEMGTVGDWMLLAGSNSKTIFSTCFKLRAELITNCDRSLLSQDRML